MKREVEEKGGLCAEVSPKECIEDSMLQYRPTVKRVVREAYIPGFTYKRVVREAYIPGYTSGVYKRDIYTRVYLRCVPGRL